MLKQKFNVNLIFNIFLEINKFDCDGNLLRNVAKFLEIPPL